MIATQSDLETFKGKILDLQGKVMFRKNDDAGSSFELKGLSLKSGISFLQMGNNETLFREKLVVK